MCGRLARLPSAAAAGLVATAARVVAAIVAYRVAAQRKPLPLC